MSRPDQCLLISACLSSIILIITLLIIVGTIGANSPNKTTLRLTTPGPYPTLSNEPTGGEPPGNDNISTFETSANILEILKKPCEVVRLVGASHVVVFCYNDATLTSFKFYRRTASSSKLMIEKVHFYEFNGKKEIFEFVDIVGGCLFARGSCSARELMKKAPEIGKPLCAYRTTITFAAFCFDRRRFVKTMEIGLTTFDFADIVGLLHFINRFER